MNSIPIGSLIAATTIEDQPVIAIMVGESEHMSLLHGVIVYPEEYPTKSMEHNGAGTDNWPSWAKATNRCRYIRSDYVRSPTLGEALATEGKTFYGEQRHLVRR